MRHNNVIIIIKIRKPVTFVFRIFYLKKQRSHRPRTYFKYVSGWHTIIYLLIVMATTVKRAVICNPYFIIA